MQAIIVDGKKRAIEIKNELKKQISACDEKPKMAVILIGDNPASQIYVRHKMKVAEEVGVVVELFTLSPVMTSDALISFVQELNQRSDIDAIMIQLPLPKHMDTDLILESIAPEKDVDGLCSRNLGKLFMGLDGIIPCTPLACLDLIKGVCPNLDGLNAVVIGRSRLVGKPLGQLLLNENCTVTYAHTHTRDLPAVCRQADILVVAAGRPDLIKKEHIKQGAIVIDVGINRLKNNKICGDVDFENVLDIAGAVTPVPGGVGPMTVAMLMKNTYLIFLKKCKKRT